ncbi:MAG: hypothetical protein ACTHU0_39475 [Kofleriaceae bacterium]
MRALVVVLLAASLLATGCATNSYRIPTTDLQQLANTPPEVRGAKVRVIQDISASDAPPAQRIDGDTEVVSVPNIHFSAGIRTGPVRGGGGGHGGGGKGLQLGGSGSDGKGAAIVFLALAAVALVAIAGVEGSRFDGWAALHPMHPVHLFGRHGEYTVVPLAWITPEAAAWAEKAVVRSNEGPWRPLERHPLHRTGATYSMYAGTGSLRSYFGDLGMGTAFTVQAGYFPNQHVGILGSVFLGWRDNRFGDVLFESRYTLELQAMPLALGPLHAGFYVGGGAAYRYEDSVISGSAGSSALTAGGQLQLDINTRIALTARFGVAKAHEDPMREALFGLSVY